MDEIKDEATLQNEGVAEETKNYSLIKKIEKQIEEKIPLPKTKGKRIAVIVIAVVIVFCVIFTLIKMFPVKQPQATIITSASLEKVLEVEELSTMEYTYKAVTKVTETNSKGKEEELYYVAYEGVVSAGIDFSKIVVAVDEDNKLITIKMPGVEIYEPTIDAGTLDYIYMKAKYKNDATVSAQAYSKCLEDLRNRLQDPVEIKTIKDLAYSNAVDVIKALTEPWIKQVSAEYKVEIK